MRRWIQVKINGNFGSRFLGTIALFINMCYITNYRCSSAAVLFAQCLFPTGEDAQKRRVKMNGTLKSKVFETPNINALVVIFVNDVNRPTGIWRGVLKETGDYVGSVITGGLTDSPCRAEIWDDRAPKEWQNREPSVNYTVMSFERAFPELIAAIEEQKREVRGLQKRMKTERDVLYGAMKAMVSPETAQKLEELIGLLLKK